MSENDLREEISPLNPFRSLPPDNFEQVHYAMCKMADKIDEIIRHLNAERKE